MSDEKSFHMTPEEFRRHGHAVVDWIADYQARVESFPVLSQVKPGEIRASLPANPPVHGEPFDALLSDVERLILPGVTHWQSPNFFAYFPCNASGPGILGDLLSSGLGVQGMLWSTSPACTELEMHLMDWLVAMLALPEKFLSSSTGGGVIQDTASSAALCALLAARERATKYANDVAKKDNEDIRGMLNAGHRKGAIAGRCVISGKTVRTEELDRGDAHDDDEQDPPGCRGESHVQEPPALVVDEQHQRCGGIARAALGEQEGLREHLEGRDQRQRGGKEDRRRDHRQRHVPEPLPATGTVDGSGFQLFLRHLVDRC